MPVHTVHIFDRKGKTLFTKCYIRLKEYGEATDEELLSEQRKLVFGMLFSLEQLGQSLAPIDGLDKSLRKIQTGASTCHCFATKSGLYFCLYWTPPAPGKPVLPTASAAPNAVGGIQLPPKDALVRKALEHIYHNLWIQSVVRSPLYHPTNPDVEATNFVSQLAEFLRKQPWYR